MTPPFNLTWSQNGSIIRGYTNGAYVEGSLVFPVSFPGSISEPLTVTLNSSAQANGTYDILQNIKFFLTGDPDDLATVQGGWPTLGNAFTPPRPEMNGGLQISFDGSTWTTFVSGSSGVGDQNYPSTWIELPAVAIGAGGIAGTLGPFDIALFYMRYVLPATTTTYKVFDINLAVDCDIV